MTFVAGWALAGLVLLVPLVILHLRQRAERTREVPSLLLWHEFELEETTATRRSWLPPLPLLLLLQAVALILLILALAAPRLNGSATRATTVVVLDDSYWMSAPGAMGDARGDVAQILRSVPGGSPVAIVLAQAAPSVFYRGPASGADAALRRWQAGAAAPDLSAGLGVATGLLSSPGDRVVVVHSPQDSLPALRASPGELSTQVVGATGADQGLFDPSARCGIGSPATCEVLATLTNTGASAVDDHLSAAVPGRAGLALSVHVGAHASNHIALIAPPGDQVHLTLSASDALGLDNQAWVNVPGNDNVPRPAAVTVVGTPAKALALAQAFAAVPGARVSVETPAHYRASVAQSSDLVVLDGWLPRSGIPATPAVMLVDPPELPGGQVGAPQADPTLSGTDPASPLLDGADLSSLTVSASATHHLILPHWLTPVLWSPSGPLMAAGDDGHTRVVVTAFSVGGSDLSQLAAFPVLATNIVSWGLGWAPGSAVAGMPIAVDALRGATAATLTHNGTVVDRVALNPASPSAVLAAMEPGVYTLSERGPGVSHQTTIDVNLSGASLTAASPVDIRTAQIPAARTAPTSLLAWLLAAALLALALEWAYWSTRRPQVRV